MLDRRFPTTLQIMQGVASAARWRLSDAAGLIESRIGFDAGDCFADRVGGKVIRQV